MGKITIDPGNLRKKQPAGEHITRIMYDDNEPPKNYIWGKPDGFLYVWNGVRWVLLNDKSNPSSANFIPDAQMPSIPSIIANGQLITQKDLEGKLKALKLEIINYLTKLINMKDCPDSGDNAIIWFRDEILPEINWIKNHLNDFATKVELQEVKQELLDMINGLSSSEIVSELVNRIEALEALPHDTYVTQQQLLDAISNVASSQTITNINNAITLINNEITNLRNSITNMQSDITNIKGDIVNIKNDINNVKADMDLNELTTSAALNDLNSRIGYIEDFGIDFNPGFNPDLDYITAEEVTDIHSIVIDD